MSEKATYVCKECGKTLDLSANGSIPECCGMPMEKLPYCRNTDTAEQARANDKGEPCDDGRAG
jgi:hypothetical protein